MTGTLAIDFFLSYLCRNTDYLSCSGCTWHFIRAIEPDGVRLNEAWFDAPYDLERYFSSFYRPALADQAEYTFPFERESHAFTRVIPEMAAWRTALVMTQPNLLCSLHNCEAGGAFFVTSESNPHLDAALMACAQRLSFDLGLSGEIGSEQKAGTRGIFPFKDEVARSIAEARDLGVHQNLHTGDSSAGFAQKQFGTFSLIPEVPMWRIRVPTPSESTTQKLDEVGKWAASALRLVRQFLPLFDELPGATAKRLTRAINDLLVEMQLTDHVGTQDRIPELLFLLRGPAMLLTLARISMKVSPSTLVRDAYRECNSYINNCCSVLSTQLEAISLQHRVQLQVASIDLAVQSLRDH
jgi:hypothetical protein